MWCDWSGICGWLVWPQTAHGYEGPVGLWEGDYISLFPLDDVQPSKLMRLLSSNEDDANVLSSPSECVGRQHAAPFPGSSLPDAAALPLPQLEASLQLVSEGMAGTCAVLCPKGVLYVLPLEKLLFLLPEG
ncbi:Mediator of RNA polymerase II transcription subunit 24 [Plecturocebus cupreus]